jgi:basic membrane protein A
MGQKLDIKKMTVAILAPGNADDGGWSESAMKAGESLDEMGFQVTSQPNVLRSQALDVAQHYCQTGVKLLIGHGCEYFLAFEQLAKDFPDVYFFVMDKPENREAWPLNFCCLLQRQYEALYLAGRLAANLTRSKKVGFIGGEKVPTQLSNERAFEIGNRSQDPSVEVLIQYTNSFEDLTLGNTIALEMIEAGADVLMHSATAEGDSVIEACRQSGTSLIGYNLEQSHMAPDLMVASMNLDMPQIYRTKALEIINREFQSGVWDVGVAEGAVDLIVLHQNLPQNVLSDIDHSRQEIIDRKIEL